MGYQSVFKRYELKFLLTEAQKAQLLAVMEPHMRLDRYGRTVIRNIYFDTADYRLVRRSIEKPVYKEKLRLRSYSGPRENSPVFVELKKKYRSVVYKRRTQLPEKQAMDWLCRGSECPGPSQIINEIEYFRKFYGDLRPAVFLTYEREAYYSLEGDNFRVTFDENILCREEEMSLSAPVWGTPLLPEGTVLMELKTPGGIPLWMTHFLTQQRIFKTSFSKYGIAYCNQLKSQSKGDIYYGTELF